MPNPVGSGQTGTVRQGETLICLYVSPNLLTPRWFQEQEDMIKRHQEELRTLHQKLDLHADTSLDRFRQTAMVRRHRVPLSALVAS